MNTKFGVLLLFLVFCHAQINQPTFNCDEPKLYDADDGLQKLKVALDQSFSQIDRLQKDIKEMRQLETLAKKGMEEEAQVSFIEVHSLQYLSTLKHKFESLNLIQLQDHQVVSNVEKIKKQIDSTLEATDPQTRRDCCQMLCTMIESLILNLLQQEQEYMKPITINFEAESKQIKIIRGECDACTSSSEKLDTLSESNNSENTFVSSEVHSAECTPDIRDSANDQKEPVFVDEESSETQLYEYGYSHWFRFLSRHPKPMYGGKAAPWYFVSRLTTNKEYSNVGKGDRLMALFQGQGIYSFITNDQKTSNWNMVKDVQYGDIEGLWTFVYFSTCTFTKKVIAFLQFARQEPIQVTFDAIHPEVKYLKLVVGGSDLNIYPAINGQFSKITLRTGVGSFIQTPNQFKYYALPNSPEPPEVTPEAVEQVLIPTLKDFSMNQSDEPEISSLPSAAFPQEYSVVGWFKWSQVAMQDWHLVFRFHIHKGAENKNAERLGDRTMAMWCSPLQGGIYHVTTYSYVGLNGGGQPNLNKNVPQGNQQTQWHFIYFGYNRLLRRSLAEFYFKNKKEVAQFDSVNHFLVPEAYIIVGNDPFSAGYNGQIGKLRMTLGKGASTAYYPDDLQTPPALIEIHNSGVAEEIEIEDQERKVIRYDQMFGQESKNFDEPSGYANQNIDQMPGQEQPDIEESIIPRLIGQGSGQP